MEKIIRSKIDGVGAKSLHNNTEIINYIQCEILGEDVKLPITKAMDKIAHTIDKVKITIEFE